MIGVVIVAYTDVEGQYLMLSARNQGGDVLASQVIKEDSPFTCPMCKSGVLVKKGRVKIHHSSHIPPSNCVYGEGESEKHREAKQGIYETLQHHPDITKLQLERPLGDVRPDISFYLRNIPIAIEVQVSTLSLDTIERRTRAYTNKGIALLWTSPCPLTLEYNTKKYSPLQWEKYLHAMYFGKMYYWVEGETLQPVRFDEHRIYVEESSWYDSDGEACYAGGYHRYAKRYRTPYFFKEVDITSLASVTRKPWKSKGMVIPAAKLWCESYQ